MRDEREPAPVECGARCGAKGAVVATTPIRSPGSGQSADAEANGGPRPARSRTVHEAYLASAGEPSSKRGGATAPRAMPISAAAKARIESLAAENASAP